MCGSVILEIFLSINKHLARATDKVCCTDETNPL